MELNTRGGVEAEPGGRKSRAVSKDKATGHSQSEGAQRVTVRAGSGEASRG